MSILAAFDPLQARSTVCRPCTLRPDAVSVIWPGVGVGVGVTVGVGVGVDLGGGGIIKKKRTGIPRCYHHHNASGRLSFNSSLQCVDRTTFRRRTDPGISSNIRSFERVAMIRCADYRVGRKEKFHALDVPGGCAIVLVHVSATDPLGTGRHSDLVGAVIVDDRCANSVSAVAQIITGLGRVVTAGVADAVVDGVMPVVIVIGICSVPTTVMRLERVMSPANTGVGASHHYSLASKAECPYARRVRA